MTTIDPIDFLEKLKEKDQDDFEDAALMIADYLQDKPEMIETYRHYQPGRGAANNTKLFIPGSKSQIREEKIYGPD